MLSCCVRWNVTILVIHVDIWCRICAKGEDSRNSPWYKRHSMIPALKQIPWWMTIIPQNRTIQPSTKNINKPSSINFPDFDWLPTSQYPKRWSIPSIIINQQRRFLRFFFAEARVVFIHPHGGHAQPLRCESLLGDFFHRFDLRDLMIIDSVLITARLLFKVFVSDIYWDLLIF